LNHTPSRRNDSRQAVLARTHDAPWRDPLGNLNLIEADYAWAMQKLMGVARRHAHKRVVSVLEGGYDLEGLARSVAAHVTTLMEGITHKWALRALE
jgi:acetoin utilization deacetylase AcuC-like enzyme